MLGLLRKDKRVGQDKLAHLGLYIHLLKKIIITSTLFSRVNYSMKLLIKQLKKKYVY